MRSYTTLGAGRTRKVLSVPQHGEARTVTWVSEAAARPLAWALSRTDTAMPNALFDVAVAHAGQPLEARRRLLARFDAAALPPAPAGEWAPAERLIDAVAEAVADEPAPVVASVRAELAGHLEGFDGVFVPAYVTNHAPKRSRLGVCLTAALDAMGDRFWQYLLEHGGLTVVDDDPDFPLGGPLVATVEWNELIMGCLYDATDATGAYEDFPVAEIAADTDVGLELVVRVDHLRAWLARHRPGDLDAFDRQLR